MNKYLFYPGCSMPRSARPYYDSLMAIKSDIDMSLEEVDRIKRLLDRKERELRSDDE
jgi:heterodisulfide reductase subunit B